PTTTSGILTLTQAVFKKDPGESKEGIEDWLARDQLFAFHSQNQSARTLEWRPREEVVYGFVEYPL
ncbi:hypothetical protein KY320_04410, partial [Candidatus Woesearchaeota archaeon]|nr:hypothetical protein [Candidatus Woesearchaeota archaeon]